MKRREDVASKGSAVEKVVVCCRRNAKLGPKWEVGVWWCWGVLSFCDASVQFTTAQGHVGYFFLARGPLRFPSLSVASGPLVCPDWREEIEFKSENGRR